MNHDQTAATPATVGALPQHVLDPPAPGSPSRLVEFVREGGGR